MLPQAAIRIIACTNQEYSLKVSVAACRSQINKHMSLEVVDNTKDLETNHANI